MKRLDCLDGLRGVLALYVLVTHMAPFALLPPVLASLLSHGEAAVDMFFVLSGLVITASIEHFEYRPAPFLLARAARILPVFVPVFAFAILVQPLPMHFAAMPWIGPDSTARSIWSDGWPATWVVQIGLHLTMLHGVFPHILLPDLWVSFLGSAWSLSTEWQFYALVAVLGARLGRGQKNLWRLAALLLALAALGAAWQSLADRDWTFSRAFLPNKAAYFALGVASGALLRSPRAWRRFAAVLAAVVALCLLRENTFKVLVPPVWTICLLAQLSPAPRRVARQGLRPIRAVLDNPASRWLGGVSYSLYLVNEPLQKVLGVALAAVVHGNGRLFTVLWLPGSVVLPLLVAWWLRVVIEVPAMRYGRATARALLDLGKPWVMAPVAGFDPFAPAPPRLPPGLVPMGFRADIPFRDTAHELELASTAVVRLDADRAVAQDQAEWTRGLCARYCPHRAGDAGGRCATSPEACLAWLTQHGYVRPDPRDPPPACDPTPLPA